MQWAKFKQALLNKYEPCIDDDGNEAITIKLPCGIPLTMALVYLEKVFSEGGSEKVIHEITKYGKVVEVFNDFLASANIA